MHVNMSAPAFQPAMKAEEKVGEDLGLCPELVERNSKIAAKISFDFADAFMRERYERACVEASLQSPSIPDRILKGNTIS